MVEGVDDQRRGAEVRGTALIISVINGIFGFILRPQNKKSRRD